MSALSAVLEETADVTRAKSNAVLHPCNYHQALVDSLSPPYTIISFNYDCVVDHALRSSKRAFWSARFGYGFKGADRIDPGLAEIWSSKPRPEKQNETIRLLKLHGSLNWRPFPKDPDGPILFRQKTYKQKGQNRFFIIPPESVKTLDEAPIDVRWSKAASAVKAAQNIALIGFSFPRTDQAVEALFRISIAENTSMNKLIIVNPSSNDRLRIRQICAPAMQKNLRVIQFESLSEFAPHASILLSN